MLTRGAVTGKIAGQLATVPAGYVWLIKSVGLRSWASVDQVVTLWVQGGSPASSVVFVQQSLWAGKSTIVQTWVAAEPGDQVWLDWTSGEVQWWISGAALPLSGG